ncbi:kinase-like domain-containing protein [Gigaspora rosea]|uniref:Kinase-like domain-containing protein n=1 Tax=Gigaspora rosea TaxID=44941 RepID=A0A397W799_9GLOM|nr:kinase-like domain-containing protein [Gigaspora rosea]
MGDSSKFRREEFGPEQVLTFNATAGQVVKGSVKMELNQSKEKMELKELAKNLKNLTKEVTLYLPLWSKPLIFDPGGMFIGRSKELVSWNSTLKFKKPFYLQSKIINSLTIIYNEENTPKVYNNLYMEYNANFSQSQTNISLLNGYNNSSKERSENLTLDHENQTNNAEITQDCEEQINLLQQQYNAKSVEENEHLTSLLEFIPYEQFTNIKYLAKGEFSVIYKAMWVDGPITRWNFKKKNYNRKGNYEVVLKCLNNSEKMDSNCLNELKNFLICKNSHHLANYASTIHQYYGITQDPKTNMMVIKFAQNRDLHYFVNKTNALSWLEKLNLLNTIALGLLKLHRDFKLIHSDLHSGNILIDETGEPTIADLGLSKPMDASSDKNAIYGVIPYVAPEVLKGGKFTKQSDIYSFGMIIWEVISGCRPFSDHLVELMNRCWESDPAKRHLDADPAKSYLNTTNIFLDIKSRFFNLIDKAKRGEIKFPENMDAKASPTEINEQAIYSSRLLNPFISEALTIRSMKLNFNGK